MKIILFSHTVNKESGLQTFELNFIKAMSEHHKILYVYAGGHEPRIREFAQYCRVVQKDSGPIEGDICLFSSLQHGISQPNIKATKYGQIVHSDLHEWHVDYNPPNYIDFHVAVGKGVQQSLKEYFGIESIVIPNIMPNDVNFERALRFVTASRIREGKGFDKVVELAKRMKAGKKHFVWEIYGEGPASMIEQLKYELTGVPEVVFMGHRDNIQGYMANSDYVVQLSISEGFCYSVHEALQVGVPCIVTEGSASDVIVDGFNGYILKQDLSNFDADKIFNDIPKNFLYERNNAEEKWNELFINLV